MAKRHHRQAKRYELTNGDKVMGTWEQAYGNWLLANGCEFVTQPKFETIQYRTPRTGGIHRYYPDFYVEDDGKGYYVEITPQYALDIQRGAKRRKLERVIEQNPDIELRILTEAELEEMGVLIRIRKSDVKNAVENAKGE